MTEHIKPCTVCSSDFTVCEEYAFYGQIVYRVVCYDCGTALSNWDCENNREETVKWFNDLHKED